MSRAAPPPGAMRLQKFLSDAGVASRRRAEELILEGRVLVNDRVVERLPAFVDPRQDVIIANGARVRIQPHEYFIVHKPRGVVCHERDGPERPRARDLLPPTRARMLIAGGLDADSTGLLFLTNDSELAAALTHRRSGVERVYRVELRGEAPSDIVERMVRGVHLAEGPVRASRVEVLHRSRDGAVLEVAMRTGTDRHVRRMVARFGCAVRRIKRLRIGPLSLEGLPPGGSRRLFDEELAALRRALASGRARQPTAGRRGAGRPRRAGSTSGQASGAKGRRGGRDGVAKAQEFASGGAAVARGRAQRAAAGGRGPARAGTAASRPPAKRRLVT